MRETCARVLAAALMTGAIATVVAMSAFIGTPSRADRPITAPSSSLQRSVRVEVRPAASHRRNVERPETAHRISTRVRPVVATRRLVIVQTRRPQAPRRRLASTKPAVAPAAPVPAARPAPVTASTPSATDPQPKADKDHGHGNASGHEKDHGHGHDGHED
jgi:hypothetical protein